MLRTVVSPSTVDWDTVIDSVQMTLNNTVNETTGETPHFLLYGYQKRMPATLLDDARPLQRFYNYNDYSVWRHRLTCDTSHKTRQAIKKAEAVNKTYYDRSAVKPSATVGRQVFVQLHVPEGPNFKVSPKFAGPFRINKVLPHNKYEILHETSLEKKVVHWNHLKLTSPDPWTKNDVEIANSETEGPVDGEGSQNISNN